MLMIAYDNGFKSCYMRWDKWFDRWERFMSNNNGGYSIPIILAIGNHEVCFPQLIYVEK